MRLSSFFPSWRGAWQAGLRDFLGALPITNAGFRNRSSDIEQTSDARADAFLMASPDTLEVIGAGWCRTGTSSLKVALDLLGCSPSFHGRFIPYLPELREDCYKYATGESAIFDVRKSFGGYRAAVDIPPGLIPLVLEAYPEAKAWPGLQSPRMHSQICSCCTKASILHALIDVFGCWKRQDSDCTRSS